VFRVWRRVLGLDNRTVLESVDYDDDGEVVVAHVRAEVAVASAVWSVWSALSGLRPRRGTSSLARSGSGDGQGRVGGGCSQGGLCPARGDCGSGALGAA
jgi:hypothetical protein